jgi:enoyl-CoA hydratase/carnithine racemase
MNAPLLYEQTGHVVTLTLNRPKLRNPITDPDMVEAVVDGCRTINADNSVRAVILTGAGEGFSSGGNMQAMKDKSGMFAGSPAELREGYRNGVQRLARAVYGLQVPVIAAINGAAIGAGLDLTLMCDMRVASTKALFAESFVRVGIIPGDGGAWLLPRVVGWSRASEMAFTGDKITPETALAWGLVSQVVEPEELLKCAGALAERVAKNPPTALRMTKQLMREGQHMRYESALEMAAGMQAIVHQTADHAEGVNAFFEKRKPVFVGR